MEVKPWTPDEREVLTMINLIISEGLLSHVLNTTRQHSQSQEFQPYTDAAGLLLTLSLRANTAEVRIRMELNQAIHTLSVEGDVPTLDLLSAGLKTRSLDSTGFGSQFAMPKKFPYLLTGWTPAAIRSKSFRT